jgi:hypothetical protein
MMHNPGYSSMMAVRAHPDAYRSLPTSPLPMDPRTLSGQDVGLALNHARMGLEMNGPDYFHHPGRAPSPRYGGLRSSSPYHGEYEGERYSGRFEEPEIGSPEMCQRYEPLGVTWTSVEVPAGRKG